MKFSIWLTKEELRLIKIKADLSGYKTLSSFIREKLLKDNLEMQIKVKAIHNMLLKKDGKKQQNSSKDKQIAKLSYPGKSKIFRI